jgi:hypothetical protein
MAKVEDHMQCVASVEDHMQCVASVEDHMQCVASSILETGQTEYRYWYN